MVKLGIPKDEIRPPITDELIKKWKKRRKRNARERNLLISFFEKEGKEIPDWLK